MRFDIEASKALAFSLSLKTKSAKINSKKLYSKKERRKNKVKRYEDDF